MWYEALPAFIIMASCITATGYGMKFLDKLFLEGKPKRYNVDDFDRRMMERDKQITGSANRQKAL